MKICIMCGVEKPDDAFPLPGQHLNVNKCKPCCNKRRGGSARSFDPSRVVQVKTIETLEPDMFSTIVVDPPWPLNQFMRRKGDERPDDYKLMTLDEIISHTPPAAPNSHLYLWVLNQRVDWGYIVARAWGFEPLQMITWTKPGTGMGSFQCNTESFLVCRKGNTSNLFSPSGGTYFYWPRGSHSEKPNQFFDLVERISPGPYLEMYARRERPNWAHWGNELPDMGVAVGKYPPRAQDIYPPGKPVDIRVTVQLGKGPVRTALIKP